MIADSLHSDDLRWALDHSRRRYRVRAERVGERPRSSCYGELIVIVPLSGGRPALMAARCARFPHEPIDSDRYAAARLQASAEAARQSGDAR